MLAAPPQKGTYMVSVFLPTVIWLQEATAPDILEAFLFVVDMTIQSIHCAPRKGCLSPQKDINGREEIQVELVPVVAVELLQTSVLFEQKSQSPGENFHTQLLGSILRH